MTADERIAILEEQLRQALERVSILEEQLTAAHRRIEELEKQKTPPPAFAKANVKSRQLSRSSRVRNAQRTTIMDGKGSRRRASSNTALCRVRSAPVGWAGSVSHADVR